MSDFRTFFSRSPDLVLSRVRDGCIARFKACVAGDVVNGYLETLEVTSPLDQEELRGGDSVYLAAQDRLWHVKILKGR
ncbi:hypothetical protein FGU46_03120 [Methanobacterium sp. CWC-01]|uniref:hypothetical protein n=1 Tax=Methanobacterium aridiramus TaxID=2584467 RepID=UPI0025773A8A|nr:hypothetical protein [Methanobacterium sp. CWC-01]WJI09151.1 hypothetical protein FGU46_03120 [Methanobacterium sp. CWC-01]